MSSSDAYEVAIVGSGPAGLTAGLFAARSGRRAIVLSGEGPGGALLNVARVDDFPGFPEGVPGYDLGPLMHAQAAAAGAKFQFAEIESIDRSGDQWLLCAGDLEILAQSVIVASGTRARMLGVPGEEQLVGRGISHCASCDGPLFREQTVGVVGGGDSGLSEALELARHVAKVLVFERQSELPGEDAYQRQLAQSDKITVFCHTEVEGVMGADAVTGLRSRDLDTGCVAEIPLRAVFTNVGREPQTGFLDASLIEVDASGRLRTYDSLRTGVEGVFAAGDVRADSSSQAVSASGDGAVAALGAHRYLAARAREVCM